MRFGPPRFIRQRKRTKDNRSIFENKIYRQVAGRARMNKKKFSLSFEDFLHLIYKNCIYCDKPPSNVKKDETKLQYKGYALKYQGIDRKDSSRGYVKDNCVPCCRECNMVKSEIVDFDEMMEVARLLKNKRARSTTERQSSQQQQALGPLARLATTLQRRVKVPL